MNKNIIWIASYPKSGNTWIRSILCSLFYTKDGSYSFEDLKNIYLFDSPHNYYFLKELNKQLYDKLNEIEIISKYRIKAQQLYNEKNEVRFFKTHSANINFKNYPYTNEKLTKGVIYIVRDPRDIAISYSEHFKISIEETITKLQKEDNIMLTSNKSRYITFLSRWDYHIASWEKINVPKLFIRYEDLIEKPIQTTIQIILFIKNNLKVDSYFSDKKILNSLSNTSFSILKEKEIKNGFSEAMKGTKFFRNGKSNQWKKILQSNNQKLIEKEFYTTMKKYNYL